MVHKLGIAQEDKWLDPIEPGLQSQKSERCMEPSGSQTLCASVCVGVSGGARFLNHPPGASVSLNQHTAAGNDSSR